MSHPDHSCQSTAGDLEHRRTATLPSTEGDYFLWHLVAEGGCAGAEERKHEPGRRTAGRRLMRTQQATCSAALRQVCSSCPHHIQHAHMHNPNPCFPANAADLGLKSCYHCQRPRLILSRVITKVRYSRSQQGTHTHTHTHNNTCCMQSQKAVSWCLVDPDLITLAGRAFASVNKGRKDMRQECCASRGMPPLMQMSILSYCLDARTAVDSPPTAQLREYGYGEHAPGGGGGGWGCRVKTTQVLRCWPPGMTTITTIFIIIIIQKS